MNTQTLHPFPIMGVCGAFQDRAAEHMASLGWCVVRMSEFDQHIQKILPLCAFPWDTAPDLRRDWLEQRLVALSTDSSLPKVVVTDLQTPQEIETLGPSAHVVRFVDAHTKHCVMHHVEIPTCVPEDDDVVQRLLMGRAHYCDVTPWKNASWLECFG